MTPDRLPPSPQPPCVECGKPSVDGLGPEGAAPRCDYHWIALGRELLRLAELDEIERN